MSTTIKSEGFESGFTNGATPNGINSIVAVGAAGTGTGGIRASNAAGKATATTRSGWGLVQSVNNSGDYAYWGLNDGQGGEQVFEFDFWTGSSSFFAMAILLRIQAFTGAQNAPSTYYRFGFGNSSTGISKAVNSGASTTSLLNCALPSGWQPNNTWLYCRAIASGTTQTILRLFIQRYDDGRWLRSDGAWHVRASATPVVSWIDRSSPITGQGYAGIRYVDATGFTTSVDNVLYTAGITCGALVCAAKTDTSVSVAAGAPLYGVGPYSVQYQSSPHGAGTWSNLGSAVPIAAQTDWDYLTFPILANTPAASSAQTGLTANTAYDYRAVLTDANGLTDTSPTLAVTTLTNTPRGWYFAASGNDANDGTSGSPKSNKLSTINAVSYNPGDTIWLNGGDSFGDDTDGRTLRIPVSGQEGAPITVDSYGSNVAILTPDTRWAIQVNDVEHHVYQNLSITPRAVDANGNFTPAAGLYDNLTTGTIEANSTRIDAPWDGLTFRNISIAGGKTGIYLLSTGGQARGACTVSGGVIATGTPGGVTMHEGCLGANYGGVAPTVTFSSPTGTAATGTAALDGNGHVVPTVATAGSGQSTSATTVSFSSPTESTNYGWKNVLLDTITIQNSSGGIYIFGNHIFGGHDVLGSNVPRNSFQNVTIQNCTIANASGKKDIPTSIDGSGIQIEHTWNALIQDCYISNCGSANNNGSGPSGCWCAYADLLLFRRISVESQTTGSADGGGFDADFGTSRILFDRCWAHDCVGAAFMVFPNTFTGSEITSDIFYRNSVAVNCNVNGTHLAVMPAGGSNYSLIFAINNDIYQNATTPALPITYGNWYMVNNLLIALDSSVTLFGNFLTTNWNDNFASNDLWDLTNGGAVHWKSGTATYNSAASFAGAGTAPSNVYNSDPQIKNLAYGFPGQAYTGIGGAQANCTAMNPASASSYIVGLGTDPFATLCASPIAAGPLLLAIPAADFHGFAYDMKTPTYSIGAIVFVAVASGSLVGSLGGVRGTIGFAGANALGLGGGFGL